MAEVLGVVASGVAVTQAAQSLGQLVVALARLWREVKDVPDTIQQILQDLELVGTLVGVVEDELESLASGVSLTSLQCLVIQRCRQAHKDLSDLVGDLGSDIASAGRRKRLLAGIRVVVLKKDTLEGYERRLQKALGYLGFAVQMHAVTSLRRQPEMVAAKVIEDLTSSGVIKTPPNATEDKNIEGEKPGIEERNETVPSASRVQTPEGRVTKRRKKPHYSSMLLGCLGIRFFETEEQIGGRRVAQATSYRIRIAPPSWLLAKVWDVHITAMAHAGWRTSFRQYAVVPGDSQVFDVVISGTFEELMDLFDKGLASPFCVGYSGLTLLQYAIMFRLDFVEPLVHLGLDLFAEDGLGHPVYSTALSDVSVHRIEYHQLLLAHGVYDKADLTTWETAWIKDEMVRDVQTFDWFLSNVCPKFYQWPLKHRLIMLDYIITGFSTKRLKIASRIFRSCGGFQPEDLRQRVPPTGRTVLQGFADAYFRDPCIALRHNGRRPWRHLRLVVRDIASVDKHNDFSAVDPARGTTVLLGGVTIALQSLMTRLLYAGKAYNAKAHRLWKRGFQDLIRAWLEDLQRGGKDLQAYGTTELAAFVRQDRACSAPWSREILLRRTRRECYQVGYRWRGFTVGPRPEDWSLIWEWDPDVEVFVGDFWASIEDFPQSVMPGSWVEVDEEDDECEYDYSDEDDYCVENYYSEEDDDEDDDEDED